MNTEKLATFFATDFPLNKEGIEELLSSFKSKFFPKKSMLIRAGETEKQLRFLETGIVREYYSAPDKETNIHFYTLSQFVTDFSSFNNNIQTKKHQECLTEVELKVLNKSVFMSLLEKYQCGKSFIDQTFQRLLEQKELFEYNRITKSPEELYQGILDHRPDWLQKVPQYHIASYLGITPETLSRIRKRIS